MYPNVGYFKPESNVIKAKQRNRVVVKMTSNVIKSHESLMGLNYATNPMSHSWD